MDAVFNDFMLGSWVKDGMFTQLKRVASHAVAVAIVGGALVAGGAAVASNLDQHSVLPSMSEAGLSQLHMQVDNHPALVAGRELRSSIHANIERLRTGLFVEDFDQELLDFAADALATYQKSKA